MQTGEIDPSLYRLLRPEHPASWNDADQAWDALGAAYLDTDPYYIPDDPTTSHKMLSYAKNAHRQSLGFGDYFTIDLSTPQRFRFDMFLQQQNGGYTIMQNATYLMGYSGSLAAAQQKNYLFTNNAASASAMNSYYHFTHDEATGVDHGGCDLINFDTAVGGEFAATQDLHLLTDYTDRIEGCHHPSPAGLLNPRHYFYINVPGDGTFSVGDPLFLAVVNNGIHNIFINSSELGVTDLAAAATADPIFELDSSGDIMIESSPAQEWQNFELDAQGDLQLIA